MSTVATGRKITRATTTTLNASGYCMARGTVKLVATVSAETFDTLKAEAIRQNTSISALVRAYLEIALWQIK